jgi:ribulose kinase
LNVSVNMNLVSRVDHGTSSGRVVAVGACDGAVSGTAVKGYEKGVLEGGLPEGATFPPDRALQVPAVAADLQRSAAPAGGGVRSDDLVGVGTDGTACTNARRRTVYGQR